MLLQNCFVTLQGSTCVTLQAPQNLSSGVEKNMEHIYECEYKPKLENQKMYSGQINKQVEVCQ